MMKKKQIILLAGWFGALLVTGNVTAQVRAQASEEDQEETVRRLDSLFRSVAGDAATHFNGTVLVTDHGRILYKNSKGYADIGAKIPNTLSTRFSLASLSKVFTCVAVLQLRDKGKLSLDDHFATFFPDFPWPAITIRQLLSHTSGLPDFREIFPEQAGPGPAQARATGTERLANRDILAALKEYGKLVAPPGTRWSYSSPAIALLASLVEKISGLSFPQYLTDYICKPAGLQHTYISTALAPVTDAGRAVLYQNPGPGSTALKETDSVRTDPANPFQTIIGPGLVVSSAEDLSRFDLALYGDALLSSRSLREMFSPVKLADGQFARLRGAPLYGGMDWSIDLDTSAGKVVSHNGGNPGIATLLIRNLRTHTAVILLENTDNMAVFSFGINAMNILNHKSLLPALEMGPPAPPPGPGPMPVPPPASSTDPPPPPPADGLKPVK